MRGKRSLFKTSSYSEHKRASLFQRFGTFYPLAHGQAHGQGTFPCESERFTSFSYVQALVGTSPKRRFNFQIYESPPRLMFYPLSRLWPDRNKPPPKEGFVFGNLILYRTDWRYPVREILTPLSLSKWKSEPILPK